jgi:AraC-like DNA-binding protein
VPAPDLLSSILREMRLDSAAYNWLELRAPWRLQFAQAGLRGVHIVARGRCELRSKVGPARLLETGDLVILPRADAHLLHSIGDARAPILQPAQLQRSGVDGRLRGGGRGEETHVVCGAFLFHEADHPALASLPRIIHVSGEAGRPARWVAAYIDALSAEAFEAGPGSQVVMARLSDALVARALRFHGQRAEEAGWLRGLQDPQIARALVAMHEQLRRSWTVEALARAAGVSRAAFATRFHAALGEPPMRYLLRRRMRHAMGLLQNDHSLAQVAESVGYGSEAALSAAFKRHTGSAPGVYRRRMKLRQT